MAEPKRGRKLANYRPPAGGGTVVGRSGAVLKGRLPPFKGRHDVALRRLCQPVERGQPGPVSQLKGERRL